MLSVGDSGISTAGGHCSVVSWLEIEMTDALYLVALSVFVA